MEDLKDVILTSQTPTPHTEEVGTVWNISGWLEPCINQVHNISFPKLYRIFKDEIGHVVIQYKHLSTDEEWHPKFNEKSLEIFKLDDHKNQIIPAGQPDPVQPNMDRDDLRDLKRSLQKDFNLAQFSPEKVEWWNSFLDQAENTEDTENIEDPWPVFEKAILATPVSTLSEKELELIKKYEEKRQALREVHTKQKNADRRLFNEQELVAVKRSESQAEIGKVLFQDKEKVEIELYKKTGQSYKPSGKRINTNIGRIFPGGFSLTRNGQLPGHIKDRLLQENLAII